jgi:AraC-like DNA-binding protein
MAGHREDVAPAPYVEARPRYHRGAADPPYALWHGAYAGFATAPHAHDFAQAVLPIAGRMRVAAGGREHVLGPEEAVILPAGVAHAFTYLDGAQEFLAVDGPPGWPTAAPGPVVVRSTGAWLMARALAAEVDAPGPDAREVLALGREALARYLARALAAPAAVPPTPEDDERTRRVLRAVDRVLRDYAAPLTVEGLAADAAMSPRHFERCFKAAVGVPPRKFLIEVRLRAARELLATTALPVAAVGAAVGYASAAHFSDAFARGVGTSPAAWRAARRAPDGEASDAPAARA